MIYSPLISSLKCGSKIIFSQQKQPQQIKEQKLEIYIGKQMKIVVQQYDNCVAIK